MHCRVLRRVSTVYTAIPKINEIITWRLAKFKIKPVNITKVTW